MMKLSGYGGGDKNCPDDDQFTSDKLMLYLSPVQVDGSVIFIYAVSGVHGAPFVGQLAFVYPAFEYISSAST